MVLVVDVRSQLVCLERILPLHESATTTVPCGTLPVEQQHLLLASACDQQHRGPPDVLPRIPLSAAAR